MLLQEESFDVLTEVLLEYRYHKMKSVSSGATRKLARFVLTECINL